MRKFIALAIAGAVAIAVVSFAVADESVQSFEAKISPKALDKTKYKPVKFFIDIKTFPDRVQDPNSDQPPSAKQTLLDFPPNMKFTPDAVDRCDVTAAELEGTTTAEAKAACGPGSQVSLDAGTHAHITVDKDPDNPDSDTFEVDAVVTGFNGNEKNSLYLHGKPTTPPFDGLPPTILTGKLKSSPVSGYGDRLVVTVPPLIAGALADFTVTVKAGKYIQARCKAKTNKFQVTTKYTNHPTTVDTFKVGCTRK